MSERALIINNEINTALDWGLLLTSKSLLPPELKTNYVELNAVNGSIDLTEAIVKEPVYSNRQFVVSFFMDGKHSDRMYKMQNIVRYLHGRKVEIIEPDNTDYYLVGRGAITEEIHEEAYSTFTITFTCDPYRYSVSESYEYASVSGSTVKSLPVYNSGYKLIYPDLEVTGEVEVSCNDGDYVTITEGSVKSSYIELKNGYNLIKVRGNGTIAFRWREGVL